MKSSKDLARFTKEILHFCERFGESFHTIFHKIPRKLPQFYTPHYSIINGFYSTSNTGHKVHRLTTDFDVNKRQICQFLPAVNPI